MEDKTDYRPPKITKTWRDERTPPPIPPNGFRGADSVTDRENTGICPIRARFIDGIMERRKRFVTR